MCIAFICRCKVWVKRCGEKHLLEIPTSKLLRKYYICGAHFDDDQYYNTKRVKLRGTAVASKCLGPELTDEEMKKYPVYTVQDLLYLNDGDVNDCPDSFDKFQRRFEEIMFSMEWRKCENCNETFYVKKKSVVKCIHGKNCCMYSKDNNMDPGDVPEELKLSYLEEQLIAKIHPIVSVFKIKNHQYGYKGHVINFPQDVPR